MPSKVAHNPTRPTVFSPVFFFALCNWGSFLDWNFLIFKVAGWKNILWIAHCKYLNARSECNDIVISVYSHYPLDPNTKSSDTKCITLSIRWFCIRIESVMTVYGNYNVIAFKSCIQIFTVQILTLLNLTSCFFSLMKITY